MTIVKKIIFVLLIIFLFSSLFPNILDYKNKISFYQQTKKEYEAEKKKQIELRTEIVKKKSADEVEKTIRNDLNLLKPNEIVIIIPSPTPRPLFITPTPAANWRQWLDLFVK